jgi:hypothetical protein
MRDKQARTPARSRPQFGALPRKRPLALRACCGAGAALRRIAARVAVPRSTGEFAYDREYTLYVGPRGAEVGDAGSQGEAPIDGRVGEVDPAVAL